MESYDVFFDVMITRLPTRIERSAFLMIGALLLSGCSSTSVTPFIGMLGCWQSESGAAHEIWIQEDSRRLTGLGITTTADGLSGYELLSLEAQPQKTVLTAYPGGTGKTEFLLVHQTAASARFENPDHDFPQWIEYTWQESALLAEIGTLDSDERTVFAKQRCQTTRSN